MCSKGFVLTISLQIVLFVGCNQQTKSTPLPASDQQKELIAKPKPTQAAAGSMYFDSFSDMADAKRLFKNGSVVAEGKQATRVVHAFAGKCEEPVVLLIFEDSKSIGADELPGVMSLSWQTLPSVLSYSGFVYQQASKPIWLPYIAMAKSIDDLETFELRFRYKGLNPNSQNVKFRAVCRLEPDLPEAYPLRNELSTLTVTDQWQEFVGNLSEGRNTKAFLDSMPKNETNCFRITWSQIGPITNYHPGDTLLIDDLDIVDLKKRPQIEAPLPNATLPKASAALSPINNVEFQTVEGFNMTAIPNPRPIQVDEKIELVSSKSAAAGSILAITVGKAAMIKPNFDFPK